MRSDVFNDGFIFQELMQAIELSLFHISDLNNSVFVTLIVHVVGESCLR